MSVFRTGVVSSFVHAAGLAIRLGFVMALVYWTSADLVGLYGLAASIEAVVVYLAGMEFHTFTSRRYARTGDRAKLRVLVSSHRHLLRFTAPLAALIGLVAALALSFTRDWIALGLLAALMTTGAVAQELGRYLILARRPVQSVVLTLLRTAAWQPIALPMLIGADSTNSLRVLLGLWTISTVVGVAWSGFLLKDLWWPLASCRSRYLLRGLKESRAYYAIASLTVVQNNLERFVLQLLLGPSAVGVYSFFQMLSNTLTALVQTATLNIALPNILIRFGQRQPDRFKYLSDLRRRVLQICALAGAAVCAIAFPLIIALSKPDYMSQLWLLPVLIGAQILMMWTQPIHLALYAAHHDRFLVRLMAGSLVAALVLDIVFIGWLGLSGAVIAPLAVCLMVATVRILLMKILRTKALL